MFFHSSSNGRISFFRHGTWSTQKVPYKSDLKKSTPRVFIARTKKSVPSKDWAFGGRSVAILSRNWDSSEKEKPTSSPLIDPRKLKKGQKPFN